MFAKQTPTRQSKRNSNILAQAQDQPANTFAQNNLNCAQPSNNQKTTQTKKANSPKAKLVFVHVREKHKHTKDKNQKRIILDKQSLLEDKMNKITPLSSNLKNNPPTAPKGKPISKVSNVYKR